MTFSFFENSLAPDLDHGQYSREAHVPKGELMGRVAVVTGAASGMGLAVSRHLADRGHRVGLLDLDGDAAQRAAEDLRAGDARALACEVDVTDRAAVDEAVRKVRTELGPVEIMVTSAGLDEFAAFTEITPEAWARILAVNLTGTFHCLQAAVPDMLAAGWGRIVTISSSSAQSGAANMAHYVASKGGVIGLTKALAVELAPHGITVNTIPPAIIDTPMARRAEKAGNVPSIDTIAGATPVRRAGTPEDVAATCAFLCSDDAGYITGQQIGVNGGWYL
jgi:2-hydroxycyclohexanecarboxyl-CoA dehydrogenase